MSRTRRARTHPLAARQRAVRQRAVRHRAVGRPAVRHALLGVLSIAGAAACQAPMSIFTGAGDGGRRVSTLTWFLIVAGALVYVGVMALFVAGMARNRERDQASVDLSERGT